jgi:hypothetical protein
VLFAADLRTFAIKLATEAIVEPSEMDIKQEIAGRKILATKRELEENNTAEDKAPYEGATRARRTKRSKQ